jgi:hypothetical protein
MQPIVQLFLELGTIAIVMYVVTLLLGAVSGQMNTMFTSFGVNSTWTNIAGNLTNIIAASMNIGGLGILVYAFVVILAILGVGLYTKTR